ncbi:MAG: hypothetical protein WA865_09800 [Spirulinaceae cyanobacterium]
MIPPITPIFLILTALGSILWYQRTPHEIYRVLATVLVVVCLIWGFAIAHWSVQLLGLFLLFKFNWLSTKLDI